MALLFNESAQALTHEFAPYNITGWLEYSLKPHPFKDLHTSTRPVALPEIITLTRYDKLPRGDVKFSRESVFARDKYRCGYCGRQFQRGSLTLDHIIPKSLGGKTTWDNIISACGECNAHKADLPLHKCGMTLKIKPHAPRWMDPIRNLYKKGRVCKSWEHFLHRIDEYQMNEED
jgi:5-methylcytosine-specific restriction endonuclease McrA